MKQQTLITTLAVLLTVSLSAIVALVLTTDVFGNAESVADTPAAIQIDAGSAAASDLADAEANGGSAQRARDTSTEAEAPANNPADSEAPDVPADEPTEAEEPTDDSIEPADPGDTPDPGNTPEDPGDQPTDPADPGDTPEDPGDQPTDPGDAPETPEDPGDTPEDPGDQPTDPGDAPETPDPPCKLGFVWNGDECFFVGCPLGFKLTDGNCTPLVVVVPCSEGFIRLPNGTCVPDLVFDPPVVAPSFCAEDEKFEGGQCVPLCPPNQIWVAGSCRFEFDVNLPEFQLPQLDFDVELPDFPLPELDFNAGVNS